MIFLPRFSDRRILRRRLQHATISLFFLGAVCFQATLIAEPAVMAPWQIESSRTQESLELYFGDFGNVPVACDYDGDGITDMAVVETYRHTDYKGRRSAWLIRESATDTTTSVNFGAPGFLNRDFPVPGDYDGDGRCDIAVFRESNNTWYIRRLDGSFETRVWDPWPETGDDFYFDEHTHEWAVDSAVPVTGDFDGDGLSDLAAFVPLSATWRIQLSSDGSITNAVFGEPSQPVGEMDVLLSIPAVGDYDGNGVDDMAVWIPKDGKWQISGFGDRWFGDRRGRAAPGDYDGDGVTDLALYGKEPGLTFEILADPIRPVSNWPSPFPTYWADIWDFGAHASVMKDGNVYRAWTCSTSPYPIVADSVLYTESTEGPTSGFSAPVMVAANGCDVTVIKVPSSIHPTFANECGGSNPVYLMYYEEDSKIFYYNDGSTSTEVDIYEDHYITGAVRTGFGNKVALRYSCTPSDTESWIKYGTVIEIPEAVPNPPNELHVGTGRPHAVYIDDKIYLTYFYMPEPIGANGEHGTNLAISVDGINFVDKGRSGDSRQENLAYHAELDLFVGTQVYALAGIDVQQALSHVFFSKDIGKIDHRDGLSQYRDTLIEYAMPQAEMCVGPLTALTDPEGRISGDSTILYGIQWATSWTCVPESDGGNPPLKTERCDPSPPAPSCNRITGIGNPGHLAVATNRSYAAEVQFDYPTTLCEGNRYGSCQAGGCAGFNERSCTSQGWSPWGACQTPTVCGDSWIDLPFAPGFGNYGSTYQAAQYSATEDTVCLRGTARYTAGIPDGATIGTLPAGFRPPAQLLFRQGGHTQGDRVDIWTDGSIRNTASDRTDWTSLDGMCFSTLPDNGGSWNDLSLGPNMHSFGQGFQNPQYRQSEDMVCLRGLVDYSGSLPTATIGTLPVGLRPPSRLLYRQGGNVKGDRVDILTDGRIFRKVNDGLSWTALDGICFSTLPANGGTWIDLPFGAGFQDFGSGFQKAQYRQTENTVCLRGLTNYTGANPQGGTIGTLPVGFRPPSRLIFRQGGHVKGDRVDVLSDGRVINVLSDGVKWTGLDGICFSTLE